MLTSLWSTFPVHDRATRHDPGPVTCRRPVSEEEQIVEHALPAERVRTIAAQRQLAEHERQAVLARSTHAGTPAAVVDLGSQPRHDCRRASLAEAFDQAHAGRLIVVGERSEPRRIHAAGRGHLLAPGEPTAADLLAGMLAVAHERL